MSVRAYRGTTESENHWKRLAAALGLRFRAPGDILSFIHTSNCDICRESRNAVRAAQAQRKASEARFLGWLAEGTELRPSGASMEYVPPMEKSKPVPPPPAPTAPGDISPADAAARFESVPVTERGETEFVLQVADFRALARYLAARLPAGREKSLALTALEEASHWANRSLALKYRKGA